MNGRKNGIGKRMRKATAVLLVLAMALQMLPANLIPWTGAKEAKAATLANPRTEGGVTTWDCVYFGTYPQSDATGATNEPIKWRVLSVNGDDAFLLADMNLDCKPYNTTWTDVTWETSTVRSWLNGYPAASNTYGTDYSGSGASFLDKAFTAEEKNAIVNQTVVNNDNPEYGTSGGNDTVDKVYLLSIDEALNPSYGFPSDYSETETRQAKNTEYAKECGAWTSSISPYTGNGWWWLRSPGYYGSNAAYVYDSGYVYRLGSSVDYRDHAIRPALHLNLSSSHLWSYAGTVSANQGEGSMEPSPTPQPTATPIPTPAQTESPFDVVDYPLEDGAFQIVPEQSGSVNDGKVKNIFPGDYSLKFGSLPINAKKSVKKDGSYTMKYTVGLGKSNYLNSDSAWDSMKSDYKTASFNTILTKFTKGVPGSSVNITSKGFSPKFNSVGYLENTYDKYGNPIAMEGGFVSSVSGKKSLTQQSFLAPIPIPVYVQLLFEVGASLQTGLKLDNNMNLSLSDGTSVSINPYVGAGAGAGIKGALSVGIEGGATLKMETKIPSFQSSAVLTPELKAVAECLFIGETEFTIAKKDYQLWGGKSSKGLLSAYGWQEEEKDTKDEFSLGNFQLIARDYEDKVERPLTARSHRVAAQTAGGLTKEEVQKNVMPNTIPQIERVGDAYVMVFQSDNKERETVNCTQLMYSVKNGSGWSVPKAVWESDTADFFSNMAVSDGELHLVWQKSKNVIASSDDVEDMLTRLGKSTEICYAKFDPATNAFVSQRYITDNDKLDMLPTVAAKEGEVSLYWSENSEDDLLLGDAVYSIYQSAKLENGAFSNPVKIEETDGRIGNLTAGYVGNEVKVAYLAMPPQSETDCFEVYLLGEGEATRISSEGVNAEALQYADGRFYWHEDGGYYSVKADDDGEEPSIEGIDLGEDAGCTANFKVLSENGKTAISWILPGESGYKAYASIREEGVFGNPVELYSCENKSLRYMDGVLEADGTWCFLVNEKDLEVDSHLISFVSVEEKTDTALEEVFVTQSEDAGKYGLEYYLSNHGEKPLNEYRIKVYSDNETYLDKVVDAELPVGETLVGVEEIAVGELIDAQEVYVSIFAEEESNQTDNEKIITLGGTDLSIITTSTQTDDTLTIQADVKNTSMVSSGAMVKLFDEVEGGNVIQTKSMDALEGGENAICSFVVDKDGLTYDANNVKYFRVEVVAEKTDMNQENNKDVSVAYGVDIDIPSPTPSPTWKPTESPTPSPTASPTATPTAAPTADPSSSPTANPMPSPTPDASVTKKKQLSKPAKLKLTAKKATWKNVANNSGYTVKIIQGKKVVKTVQLKKGKTSYTIPRKLFKKGKKYKFTIVAKGKGKYKNSKLATSKVLRIKK